MRKLAALWGLLFVTSGCDPGFSYVLPEGTTVRVDGTRYVVGVGEGVEVRFYASVSIKNGHSEIEVINTSDKPIKFTPVSTKIIDANGKPVEARGCTFFAGGSQAASQVVLDPTGPPSIIGKGYRATVRCGFQVEFASGRSYSRAFEKMTFLQPGFATDGRELPVSAAMVWDLSRRRPTWVLQRTIILPRYARADARR